MVRYVHCYKARRRLEGLEEPPYYSNLGIKIYKNISKKSWAQWLEHQTKIINEYGLNLSFGKVREFIFGQTMLNLFGTNQPNHPLHHLLLARILCP